MFAWGSNQLNRLAVPPLPPGLIYTDVTCCSAHSIALRSDGMAVSWGPNVAGEGTIPSLPVGVTYVDAAVEALKSVLLRSDGSLVMLGYAQSWQASEPQLPSDVHWRDIDITANYAAGLRSDGQIEIWGNVSPSLAWWRPVPALPFGVYYVEIVAGYEHIALRRSDGQVDACGNVGGKQHIVPPLAPGTSYLRLGAHDTSIAVVGPESTYVSFAAGCAGSRPASRLVPRDTPLIGHTLRVAVLDLPIDLAFMVMGWQSYANPISLAAIGMPGCAQHVSMDAVVALSGQGHQVEWSLPIPALPALVGVQFYNQAVVLDPAAGNAMMAIVSDAASGLVGAL